MKELFWSGGIVLAAYFCAAIGKAVFWWRSVQPFEPHSYDLEPYEGALTDDEEAKWADIEARLKAEGAQ